MTTNTPTAATLRLLILAGMARATPIPQASVSATTTPSRAPTEGERKRHTTIIGVVVVLAIVFALISYYIHKHVQQRRKLVASAKALAPQTGPAAETAPFLPQVRQSLSSAWRPVATLPINVGRGIAVVWNRCTSSVRGVLIRPKNVPTRESMVDDDAWTTDDAASVVSYESAAPSYHSTEIPRYTYVDPFAPYIQMAFPSPSLSLEDVSARTRPHLQIAIPSASLSLEDVVAGTS